MNKKELSEIKKQFKPEHCAITRICGCYVDSEKHIRTTMKEAFLSLPEEEMFKYFQIFRQTLSGTLGKNLLNMDFPIAQEAEGGTQEFLLRLRGSKLENDDLLLEFYSRVIQSYDYTENYYIILIHGVYDVPGKASDNLEMFDASDEVYEYLLCSICPVRLSKPGLFYNTETNTVENHIQDWMVDVPAKGFLFPVFNDRGSDIHSLLYYSKNPEDLQEGFVDAMFGCGQPVSAKGQQDTFHTILSGTLGEECDYETIRNIHENLYEMIEETKDSPDPLILSKPDVRRLMEASGVPKERMEHFEQAYEQAAGENLPLIASNIAAARKFTIDTPNVSIKVAPDRTDLIETRIVDGRKCIVIAVEEGVEVNGVPVDIHT